MARQQRVHAQEAKKQAAVVREGEREGGIAACTVGRRGGDIATATPNFPPFPHFTHTHTHMQSHTHTHTHCLQQYVVSKLIPEKLIAMAHTKRTAKCDKANGPVR